MKRGGETFTHYREEDEVMHSGTPEFHVRNLQPIEGEDTFTTDILGYHGLFKYHLADVRAISPEGSNAYMMGEPTIIWEGGNPEKHTVPISFFRADVDTSQRVLREEEVKADRSLAQRLIT